jgi:hypothetical protein
MSLTRRVHIYIQIIMLKKYHKILVNIVYFNRKIYIKHINRGDSMYIKQNTDKVEKMAS